MNNYSGLTCRAFARVGSTAGSHDRAHTGSGSLAEHSEYTIQMQKYSAECGRVGRSVSGLCTQK